MKKLIFMFIAVLACVPAVFAQQQIEIVFDSSRSMLELVGNESKLEAAKKSIVAVADQIAPGANVGLRVFGTTPVQGNVRESCFDSQLLMPIAVYDKAGLIMKVMNFQAHGQTPLGYSLELAGKDFNPSADVKKTVILISDGEESCGKDPVAVVRNLKAQGIDIKVHAIGFAVDDRTRSQLQQISQITGGTYKNANNAAELKQSLQEVAQQEKIAAPAASVSKAQEPAQPPAPEELLLKAGRESGQNLLAATAGAKIVSATNEDMAELIDGDIEHVTGFYEGDSAVFSFKDGQAVLVDGFAVPVAEESGNNPEVIEWSGSTEGPETGFFPLMAIKPKNKVDFKNINQQFKAEEPAAVRFLKVRIGSSVTGGGPSIAELMVNGKYLSEDELKETLSKQRPRERNLLAKDAGGRMIAASDPSFENLIDGMNETVSIEAEQEAVFGFSQDKMALISGLAVPIFESSSYNCQTFEFSASETGPAENFLPVGTFKTQNLALAGSPYQEFKFPEPVRAKYLKMKLIEGHDGSSCELAEVRAMGILAEEGTPPAAQP